MWSQERKKELKRLDTKSIKFAKNQRNHELKLKEEVWKT